MKHWAGHPPLAMLLLSGMTMLAGCQTSLIPTSATSAAVGTNSNFINVAALCREWRPVSYSRRDTPETQRDVKGSNAFRSSICE